ncbi:MAG: hypothetical protein ABI678_08120 [Kofleriaceae bacterium]
MGLYHVFVDGAADGSPAGRERLAAAIAEHYGLPVADLRARIASGRFRVKGNCDQATADSYVRDLSALGARCSTEEASPSNAAKTPLPFPAITAAAASRSTLPPRTTAPPPTASALPPRTTPTPPTGSVLPPRQTTPPATARTTTPAKGFQSGLAAAFSGEQQVDNLGALDDGALLKLSSVDGTDDAPAAAFAPPPEVVAKPGKPAASAPVAAKPKDEPLDMFAPPDANDAAFTVDLAPDEVERAAKKRASVPPETAPVESARASRPSLQPPTELGRASRPSIQAPNRAGDPPRGLQDPKTRFAAGVLLSIVLGFIPAHFVAHARERSEYAAIDHKVAATQAEAVTAEDYAALDTFRAGQLERKHDERRNIALLAMLIWAAAGSAVAYVWFRRLQRGDGNK